MNARCLTALAGLIAVGFVLRANPTPREDNLWPLSVHRLGPERGSATWMGAGPFLFQKPAGEPAGGVASGFRPFWVQTHDAQGVFRAGHLLYPLFSYTVDDEAYRWSVLELIRRQRRAPGAGGEGATFTDRDSFEIFPLWFSRQSSDPEARYFGIFPLQGTLRHRLGFDRVSWTLFPLHLETENRGAVTTATPWPFIRVTRGEASGWGLWPLFNLVERPGVSRHETYLWPLGYRSIRYPAADDPPGTEPRRDVGVLPFYARSSGPGFVSEDFAWPFFGYTDRTQPKPYREHRYFWPLLVQGRGEERMVNRWAPFYTHSIDRGYDKRWYLWPLLRHASWTDEGVDRTRSQFLFFVYWREEQRAAGRANSPVAGLTHLWPLLSEWDNGAGRRQWQVFSPLEVFFPGNEKVRQAWTPFLALARHDQRAPGSTRTALLWNAITFDQDEREKRSEFHLGPLVGVTREGGARRIAIGRGLFGLQRAAGGGWRAFWWDFPAPAVGGGAPGAGSTARPGPSPRRRPNESRRAAARHHSLSPPLT